MTLSKQDEKDMVADAYDPKRRQEFLLAEKKRKKTVRSLDDYIEFLMFVQKFKPFEHKKHVPPNTSKNLL